MDWTELDRLRGRAGDKSTGRHAAGYAACAWRRFQDHCRSVASRTLKTEPIGWHRLESRFCCDAGRDDSEKLRSSPTAIQVNRTKPKGITPPRCALRTRTGKLEPACRIAGQGLDKAAPWGCRSGHTSAGAVVSIRPAIPWRLVYQTAHKGAARIPTQEPARSTIFSAVTRMTRAAFYVRQ
jgi:hypothetical protein